MVSESEVAMHIMAQLTRFAVRNHLEPAQCASMAWDLARAFVSAEPIDEFELTSYPDRRKTAQPQAAEKPPGVGLNRELLCTAKDLLRQLEEWITSELGGTGQYFKEIKALSKHRDIIALAEREANK